MIKSLSQYKEDYRKSVENPAEFWSEYSKSFLWKKEPSNILSWNFEDPDVKWFFDGKLNITCLLYTSPSPRDTLLSRMPSSA